MTLEFKKLDAYRNQHLAIAEKTDEFSRATARALEDHQAAKAEYESVMRQGLIDGVDVSRKLDDLDVKVADTLKHYERKKREAAAFSSLDRSFVISKDDVWHTWNDEVIPTYRREKFDGVLDSLIKAKADYVRAVKAYVECVEEVEGARSDALSSLGDDYTYKLQGVKFGNITDSDKYFMGDELLYRLHSGRFDYAEIQSLLKQGGASQ